MRYYFSLFAILTIVGFSTASADLVGKWTFDGESALTDSSGKGNNLSVNTGSAAVTDGAFNVAGTNRLYVDLGSQAQLNNFTISAWVKNTGWSWQDAWEIKGSVADSQVGLRLEANASAGSYTIYTSDIPGFKSMAVNKLANPADGWHHILYTVDSSGSAKVYLDGVNTNNGTGLTATGNMGKFTIGGCYGVRGPLVGQMDNVQVYDRALQSAEIVALYDNANRTTGSLSDVYSRSVLTGSANWSASAWAVNGSDFTNAWLDGNTAAVTFGSGVTLTVDQNVSADKLVFAGLASDQTANLNGSSTLTLTDTAESIYVSAGTINSTVQLGAGSNLVKTGAGTFKIASQQTAAMAGITIYEGTLALAGGGYGNNTLKTAPLLVNKNGTLTLAGNFPLEGNAVTVDGGLLHITGAELYINNLTLQNGARVTANSATTGNGDGNCFRVGNNYGTGTNPVLTVSGSSGSTIDSGILLTAHGSSQFSLTVNSTGDASGVDLTINGQLRDYGKTAGIKVVKSGAGTVLLTNNTNNWANGLDITEGAVRLGAQRAAGAGTINLSAGAALQLAEGVSADVYALIGAGTVSAMGTGATINIGKAVNVGSAVVNSGATEFSGSFAAKVSLVKTGTGTLTLNKAGGNGAIAGVSVTEGTLALSGSGLLPTANEYGYFGNSTINVSGSGKLSAGEWNVQNTPVVVTGEDAELIFSGSNYANSITLTDGADISGGAEYRTGYWKNGTLTVNGTGTGSVISAGKFMLVKNGATANKMTIDVADTGAIAVGNPDLTIQSQIVDHAGLADTVIFKTGAGTMALLNGSNSWTGGLTVEEGRVLVSSQSALGTGPVVVNPGAALGLLASSAETYPVLTATLNSGSALDVYIDSSSEYSRFALASIPDFDPASGFLEMVIADSAELSSSSSFKLSNAYPGGSAVDLDLESWLKPELRNEWNLGWSAGSSALTLSRDSAAVPEPGTWALLILGVLLIPVLRNKRRG